MRAGAGEILRHRAMHHRHLGFGEEALAHPGLVGDDEDEIAGIIEALDRGCGAGHPADFLGLVRPAGILDQHAVAVEEDGRAVGHGGDDGLCRGQILGDADIDEGAIIERAAQLAGGGEAGEDIGFHRDGAGADMRQYLAPHEVDAAIDRPCPVGRAGGETVDDALGPDLDRAIARARCLPPQRQGGQGFASMQAEIEQVHIKAGIAIEQQETLFQLVSEEAQAAGGAERLGFDQHLDARAGDGFAVIALDNGLAEIAGEEGDAGQAVAGHLLDQPIQEGAAGDLHHGLGDAVGERAEPGAAAANQNGGLARRLRHGTSPLPPRRRSNGRN